MDYNCIRVHLQHHLQHKSPHFRISSLVLMLIVIPTLAENDFTRIDPLGKLKCSWYVQILYDIFRMIAIYVRLSNFDCENCANEWEKGCEIFSCLSLLKIILNDVISYNFHRIKILLNNDSFLIAVLIVVAVCLILPSSHE